jgi:hypothetical protein
MATTNPISTALRTAATAIVASCLALGSAAPANAGSYRAAVCHPGFGAGWADAAFERSSRHFLAAASCEAGGRGLTVSHERGRTANGRWGNWQVRAPSGTGISRLSVYASGRRGAGHVPEPGIGTWAGSLTPFATPRSKLRRVTWSGSGARVIAAGLRCERASGCGHGRDARVRIVRLVARLVDRFAPSVRLDGSLFAPGSRRGSQAIEALGADLGGGVRQLLVQVNGNPVTTRTVPCRIVRQVATRLRACPRRARAGIRAATASPPFRQGLNLVRVCAADYAPSTAANRGCAERRVRVDNLCPISRTPGGGALRARLLRHESKAVVAGRLLDRRGRPVAGARVCVATRIRMRGDVERVVATPLTDARGRFRAGLGDGPSRDVRVAHWADARAALERHLDLRVRVHPRLVVRPRGSLHNGDRVRFEVRLPGPAAAGRRVRIQVRDGGRWLDLRQGHTGNRGILRARYRFHATTGRRRYAFRAAVPKQSGYPYEAGRSRVKRVTVIGD